MELMGVEGFTLISIYLNVVVLSICCLSLFFEVVHECTETPIAWTTALKKTLAYKCC